MKYKIEFEYETDDPCTIEEIEDDLIDGASDLGLSGITVTVVE